MCACARGVFLMYSMDDEPDLGDWIRYVVDGVARSPSVGCPYLACLACLVCCLLTLTCVWLAITDEAPTGSLDTGSTNLGVPASQDLWQQQKSQASLQAKARSETLEQVRVCADTPVVFMCLPPFPHASLYTHMCVFLPALHVDSWNPLCLPIAPQERKRQAKWEETNMLHNLEAAQMAQRAKADEEARVQQEVEEKRKRQAAVEAARERDQRMREEELRSQGVIPVGDESGFMDGDDDAAIGFDEELEGVNMDDILELGDHF